MFRILLELKILPLHLCYHVTISTQLKVNLMFPCFFTFSFTIILKVHYFFSFAQQLWSQFCTILPICTSSPASLRLKVPLTGFAPCRDGVETCNNRHTQEQGLEFPLKTLTLLLSTGIFRWAELPKDHLWDQFKFLNAGVWYHFR